MKKPLVRDGAISVILGLLSKFSFSKIVICLIQGKNIDWTTEVYNNYLLQNKKIDKESLVLTNFKKLMKKGSQLGAFCPKAIVYCYLEFKLCFLNNLKLFSIRVKELFEPIVCGEKSPRVFAFLKAFS